MTKTQVQTVAMALLLAVAAGCGGGARKSKTARLSIEEQVAKKMHADVKQALDVREDAIKSNALALDVHLADLRFRARVARKNGLDDFLPRIGKMEQDAERAFQNEAAVQVKKAVDGARALLAEGKLFEAKRYLGQLPPRLKRTEHWQQVEAFEREIQLSQRAKKVFEDVVDRKSYDMNLSAQWQKLRGLYESFLLISAFQTSPEASEVQKMLDEILPKAEEARKAQSEMARGKWVPAYIGKGDEENWVYNEPYAATLDDSEVVVFKHQGKTDYVTMMFGEETWTDYVVELKLKHVSGDMYFNFRGAKQQTSDEESVRRWGGKHFEEGDLPEGEFIKVRFTVQGQLLSWTVFGDETEKEYRDEPLKGTHGPFEIRLARNAEVHIKSVWVKVLEGPASPKQH